MVYMAEGGSACISKFGSANVHMWDSSFLPGYKKNDNFTMKDHYAPAKGDTTPSGWACLAAQRLHTPMPSALQHVR